MVWISEIAWGLNNIRYIPYAIWKKKKKKQWAYPAEHWSRRSKMQSSNQTRHHYQHQIQYQTTKFQITRNNCNIQQQSRPKSSDPFPSFALHSYRTVPCATPNHLSAPNSTSKLTWTLQPGTTDTACNIPQQLPTGASYSLHFTATDTTPYAIKSQCMTKCKSKS